jgi:hypothetical protein
MLLFGYLIKFYLWTLGAFGALAILPFKTSIFCHVAMFVFLFFDCFLALPVYQMSYTRAHLANEGIYQMSYTRAHLANEGINEVRRFLVIQEVQNPPLFQNMGEVSAPARFGG